MAASIHRPATGGAPAGPSGRRVRRAGRAAIAAVALMAALVGLGAASAATLDVTSSALYAADVAGTPGLPSPEVVVDEFTTPGPLDGRDADVTGQPWTVHTGDWYVDENGVLTTNSSANASATVDAGVADATVAASIAWGGGNAGNAAAGVVVNQSAAGEYRVVVDHATDVVRMTRLLAGTETTVAATPIAIGPATDLEVHKAGTTWTVRADGIELFTHTAGQDAVDAGLPAGTRMGLFLDKTNKVHFASFTVAR